MKHFKPSEFDCKCGCGLNNFSLVLEALLELMREECNFPFNVVSGCRCETHNINEGGKPWSDHLTGEGVDIRVTNSLERFLFLSSAFRLGFKRIGISKTFIHLGINKSNPQKVLWPY